MTTVQEHEIILYFGDVSRIAGALGAAQGIVINRINGLLPSNFQVEGISINQSTNTTHIFIYEYGNQVIQFAVIAAIVAVVLVVLGVLLALAGFAGMIYRENKIIRETLSLTQEQVNKLREIMDNPNLTPEEKEAAAKDILQNIPSIVIPPPVEPPFGGGLGDLLKGVGGVAVIILLIAVAGALKKNDR